MSEPLRRGRPRSLAVHEAILDATREVLAESGGYADVTMDRVAARAGVGKQTLYRRWTSKAPLVAEAVMDAYHHGHSFDLPDSGDVARDLRTWLHRHADFLSTPSNAALVRALAAAAAHDPDDGDVLYRQLTGPQHDAILRRLRQAVDTGEVRADADLAAAAEALIGATLYRMLTRTTPIADMVARFDGLVTVVLAGIARA